MTRNWSFQPTVRTWGLPPTSELEKRFSDWVLRWLQPWLASLLHLCKTLWCTAQLDHSWILDPQILCEIIFVCCFKLLSFGVISYAAIENEYNNMWWCVYTKLIFMYVYIYLYQICLNNFWLFNLKALLLPTPCNLLLCLEESCIKF